VPCSRPPHDLPVNPRRREHLDPPTASQRPVPQPPHGDASSRAVATAARLTVGGLFVAVAGLQIAGARTAVSGGAFVLFGPVAGSVVASGEALIGVSLLLGRAWPGMISMLWTELAIAAVVLVLKHEVMFDQGVAFRLAAPGQPLIRHVVLMAIALPVTALACTRRRSAPGATGRAPSSTFPRALP